jgi:ABC-type dipeptide/oligopeptide/nickel transport system ATPase component
MTLNDEEFRKNVRWKMMSMVPQAAMNSLNPVLQDRRSGMRAIFKALGRM